MGWCWKSVRVSKNRLHSFREYTIFHLALKESNYDIQIEGQGNQYRMNPIALCRYLTDVYGELDLVYQITGNNTASEDTVTDSVSPTNNYTVFQNCDKSNIRNYCCVEML